MKADAVEKAQKDIERIQLAIKWLDNVPETELMQVFRGQILLTAENKKRLAEIRQRLQERGWASDGEYYYDGRVSYRFNHPDYPLDYKPHLLLDIEIKLLVE